MSTITREYKHITDVVRHVTSKNGNPTWRVHFTDGTSMLTKTDAQVGYVLGGVRDVPVSVSADGHRRIVDVEFLHGVTGEWTRDGDWAVICTCRWRRVVSGNLEHHRIDAEANRLADEHYATARY